MKKIILLSTVIVTTAILADDITVNATVPPAAIVGFDTPISENLVGNVFKFKDITIDIGSIPLGSKIAPVVKDIYAKTNAKDGITMEVIDHDKSGFLAGHLVDDAEENMVQMKYSLMGSSYSIKNHPARDLITTTSDGASSIGTFVIEQKNNTSSDQPNGHYSAMFDVVIAAR